MGEVIGNVVAVLPEFTLAVAVLAMIPGPATALILHRALRDGRAAGFAAMAGAEVGTVGWALAAGAGLTALLQANRILFDAMHVLGAAVLVYLGISAWRGARHARDGNGEGDVENARARGRTTLAAFRASLLSIAANPKAAVFAFSFFPQFLPRHGHVLATTLALAVVEVLVDVLIYGTIVLVVSRVGPWLARAAVRRRIERTMGAALVAVGAGLAAETR